MITVNFEGNEIKLRESLPVAERLAAEKSILDALKDIEYGRRILEPAFVAMYFLMYCAEDFTMPMVGEGDKASVDMDFMIRFDRQVDDWYFEDTTKHPWVITYKEIEWAASNDMDLFETTVANAPTNEMVMRLLDVLDTEQEQVEKIGFSVKKLLDKTQKQVNRKNLNEFLKNLENRMVGELPKFIKDEAAAGIEEDSQVK